MAGALAESVEVCPVVRESVSDQLPDEVISLFAFFGSYKDDMGDTDDFRSDESVTGNAPELVVK